MTNEINISADERKLLPDFQQVFRYRGLLWLLVVRDIRGKYRQSVLGPLWAIVQPVLTMVVFSLLFGILLGRGNLPTVEGIPYAISVYCALMPWQLFQKGAARSSESLVAYNQVITKIYFPRVLIPASAIFGAFVDFLLAFTVLVVMMMVYGIIPPVQVLLLPCFVLLGAFAALAVGLWFAGLHAVVRDVGHGLPNILQFAMYATPVVYSSESVIPAIHERIGEWAVTAYWLNPMACVVEGCRWCLLDAPPPPLWPLLGSIAIVGLTLLGGLWFFTRLERQITDLI